MSSRQRRHNQSGYTVPMGVIPETRAQQSQATLLAQTTGLPLLDSRSSSRLLLMVRPDRIELQRSGDPTLSGSVYADFLAQGILRRIARIRAERLIQAVRISKQPPTSVIDATAGLGRDGFLLAAAGSQVLLVERHPVVAALLQDGLTRAANDPRTRTICAAITVATGNFQKILTSAEVVYLDPMFPEKRGTAKVKKELQMLQYVIGPEAEDPELLDHAMDLAQTKVVVKRPLLGKPLNGCQPSYSLAGKTTRFDIYLNH
ncbi:MAG: rRNA methyltransferase [Desulfobulbus propionicus]|nr:MAG: rRNA methyltransferase [Desulfobulbus propionicus]